MEGERDQSSSSSPLFWSQSRKAPSFSASPPPPSSGIRTWVLVLLVSIFLILFIPSFRSSKLLSFRPSFVKNGWDTLNIALVIFAILCGLLGRDVASGSNGSDEYKEVEEEKITSSSSSVPQQSVYETNQTVGIRRFKSSSSYPDLRQEFNNDNNWAMTNTWRFSDDIQLYRRRPSDYSEWEISGDSEVKTIQVDTFELKKSPSKSPQPNRRTVRKLQHTQPSITPPPPPPPPPPPVYPKQNKKSNKKRSGAAAKDIATAIALFYSKKKRRSKTKKINDEDSIASASPVGPSPPPPPPPPPLPSSSVFSQLFSTKKGGTKSRRFNSISDQRSPPEPPPLPPPLPPKKQPLIFSDQHLPPRRKREKKAIFMNAYPIAPLSPLPPPPPPPPPISDEDGSDAHLADGAKGSPFCPSPDVNNKADVFIKHFRDGLKLEKLNSIREKQQRRQDQRQDLQQEAGIEMEMEHQIMKMMMMGMEEDNWTLI